MRGAYTSDIYTTRVWMRMCGRRRLSSFKRTPQAWKCHLFNILSASASLPVPHQHGLHEGDEGLERILPQRLSGEGRGGVGMGAEERGVGAKCLGR